MRRYLLGLALIIVVGGCSTSAQLPTTSPLPPPPSVYQSTAYEIKRPFSRYSPAPQYVIHPGGKPPLQMVKLDVYPTVAMSATVDEDDGGSDEPQTQLGRTPSKPGYVRSFLEGGESPPPPNKVEAPQSTAKATPSPRIAEPAKSNLPGAASLTRPICMCSAKLPSPKTITCGPITKKRR